MRFQRRDAKTRRHYAALSIFIFFLLVLTNGCGPTYPKEKITESILRVCKNEYKLDVKAETIGRTIAIYVPLENLIDFTFSITRSASEKINDVILSVSRVALSTDANYEFYCVIAHDVRLPEIQIVIIKSVDDVKRFLLNDISRDEYSKRMIIDIRLSPQAQKERSIKDVFEKMKIDKKWQEDILNDFFRSEPAGLGDIGYWNNRFFVKDVAKPEFVAEQIASRVKMGYREDKVLLENLVLRSVKCSYAQHEDVKSFNIEFTAEDKPAAQAEDSPNMKRFLEICVKVAAHVLHNYRIEDFNYLEIWDQKGNSRYRVKPDILEAFRKKKVKFKDVLAGAESF